MNQSRRQFLAETDDLIESILDDLDELREKSHGVQVRREFIDAIFRRVHRVKGSAVTFGLDGLSEIAHEFESLLSSVRAGRTAVDDDVLNACEDAANALSESLHLASSGVVESSRLPLFDRMQAVAQGIPVRPGLDSETILSKVPFEIWQSLTDDEKHRLVQAVEEGAFLCVVTTSFAIDSFDDQFSRLKDKLGERGEIIATAPAVDPDHSDKINFRVLFASKSNPQDVKLDFTDLPGVNVTSFGAGRLYANPEGSQSSSRVARLRMMSGSSLSNFIRTDLDELDRLISSNYELFRTTAKALNLALSQTQIDQDVREELVKLDAQIRRSFLGVEKELIGLRMVSLGPILQRAARAGRVAARLSHKEIDFQIVGAELRLDRLLADAIADPLVHLVRNAVDHGIEAAEPGPASPTRKRGLVRIEATSEGKQTCLRVIDNGRGVDPELISRAAIRMGIIDRNVIVDMDRSLRLIFRPGFTTIPSASFISGRGVGLDVVETAVEQVGGELRVSSEPRKGATFEIRLPVTFGLLHSTVVLSGGSRYCIDAKQIVKTQMIEADQIETDGESETLTSDKDVLPLIRLRKVLGQTPDQPVTAGRLTILACELGSENVRGQKNRRIGVIVDGVEGSEEVLVRNLGRHAARWPGIAGATELRDGNVALVLDLPRLTQR
ncbi:MAG: chemotaxis protein CheA [Pyrinomonadaceae bacterium]